MRFLRDVGITLAILFVLTAAPAAQPLPHRHEPAPEPTPAREESTATQHQHTSEDQHTTPHESMHPGTHARTGMYGPYAFTREASGTSWQPESAEHEALHLVRGDWMLMLHGMAHVVYNDQGGARGDEEWFSPNMLMFMAQRPVRHGSLGFRAMLTAEPLTIGEDGYALLLQTGESADGRTPLIDRQHPHDLFMELALAYAWHPSSHSALFAYFGLPGEPALGPPAFMHRYSAVENPAAPITHHWLDSSHITFGVGTVGYVNRGIKLEGSVFTGREPDHRRSNFEEPRFDSYSLRASFNPSRDWALQASFGRLESVEQLHPEVDTDRVTVSALYNRSWERRRWQSLLAWGRNRNRPGRTLDAFLLESTVAFGSAHTTFVRLERVEKDELFPENDPLADQAFTVGSAAAGYVYDFYASEHLKSGIGASATVSLVPSELEGTYGETPVSAMVFVRALIR